MNMTFPAECFVATGQRKSNQREARIKEQSRKNKCISREADDIVVGTFLTVGPCAGKNRN